MKIKTVAPRALGATLLTLGLLGAGMSPAQAEPVCDRHRDPLEIVAVGVDYCTDGTNVSSFGVFVGTEDGSRTAVHYQSGINEFGENFTSVCIYPADNIEETCVELPIS